MLPTNTALPLQIQTRNQAMNWLLDTYPLAFDLRNRRPLKPSIIEDIKQHAHQPSISEIKQALHYYMHWGSYLNAIVEGNHYLDLKGIPCGSISKNDALMAQKKLAQEAKKHLI